MAADDPVKSFLVRLTGSDIVRLDAAAKAAGCSRNRFVLDLILARLDTPAPAARRRRPSTTAPAGLTAADFE